MIHTPFPKIQQFRQFLKYLKTQEVPKILQLSGRVKLHGTHADLLCKKDTGNWKVQYQSRNTILTQEQDNCGFAAFMDAVPKEKIIKLLGAIETIINETLDEIFIAGEFCGSNIQSGVALTKLPRMFVIFAIKVNGIWQDISNFSDISIIEYNIYNICKVNEYTAELDTENPESIIETLKNITETVEKECPWAKSFGISGVGEGVVWRPTNIPNKSTYWFKVKGEKHASSKVTTLKEISKERLETLQNCKEFVSKAVTEARLQQGLEYLREMNLEISPKSTGNFIKWITQDTLTEEIDIIAQLNLDVTSLRKEIGVLSRNWFKDKIR